ncbi:MAG: prepilin-type N-terminal cleavage/methylation domain-containing protein [Candidatus Yanofskybacteria bacterium]|nr:prepilin-type N-terminal cleavage/methylation domain-containing protein [Candidatus Yanofskybacteria bacterium]
MRNSLIKNSGFTLVETLIAIGIFAIISVAIYSSYSNVLDIVIASQINSTGLTIIANELETVRNIRYDDVGIQGGAPAGIIPPEKNINFSGIGFTLSTTVRNVDDPFDGVLGGSPNDTAPADYKIVEMELSCTDCLRFIPIKTTTTIAPVNLESASRNGNLFINVINASGQPVSQANVSVTNSLVSPAININDVTNNGGQLQLVDIATSSLGYQITVSKSGYSVDRTYKPGLVENPNPVKPHATVSEQQVTVITFGIDRLSVQDLNTRDKFCRAVPSVDFNQRGDKLIGVDPDVFKYSVTDSTGVSGSKASNLEWDTYILQNSDTDYDLAGSSLLSPFSVNAGTDYTVNWLMEPRNGSSLLVAIEDGGGQFIDGASMSLVKAEFSDTKISGHNYLDQTDWSNGKFSQKSQNIEEANPVGELRLKQIDGKYASMSWEWLESSTFDLGTLADFYKLKWNPSGQPSETGVDSLKFQIATNNDNSTWDYIGPDGTSATYYTNSDSVIYAGHNGDRYLRYKVYLFTENQAYTPRLEGMSIEFSSSCIPSGQSFFSGLTSGIYILTVKKSGYQTYTASIDMGSSWQEHRAILVP